jgi:hypothetical protein
MTEDKKRYLAVIQFKADTPIAELAKRVPGLQNRISNLADQEMEQVFRSPEGLTFGVFFKSNRPTGVIWSELDHATGNGDSFLVFEAGPYVTAKGFGRAATWLQRH